MSKRRERHRSSGMFSRLQVNARLWDMKGVFSGGSNHAVSGPLPVINQEKPQTKGMKPGEFYVRKK
jgi:alpha-D-ribose 1-methylphosphonate 5-triphosphate synthase subunit PhnL